MSFFNRRSKLIRMAVLSIIAGFVYSFFYFLVLLYFYDYHKRLFEPFGFGEWIGPFWPIIIANLILSYKIGKTILERFALCILGLVLCVFIFFVAMFVYIVLNPIPF